MMYNNGTTSPLDTGPIPSIPQLHYYKLLPITPALQMTLKWLELIKIEQLVGLRFKREARFIQIEK